MNLLLILATVLAIAVVAFLLGWVACALIHSDRSAEIEIAYRRGYQNGRREGYRQASAVAVQVIRTGAVPDVSKQRN